MNNKTNPAENDIHNDQSNWYAKLHPIGTAKQAPKRKRLLNLSIFFRIWLAVALVLVICGVVVFTQLFGYVKPTAQQVIEDMLLDTSKLLAASLQVPLSTRQLYDEEYQAQLDAAFIGMPAMDEILSPTDQAKSYSSFRVYVTDSSGIVIYDSLPPPDNNEGQNYGRWNDVYLTLKGQYGARSTLRDDQRRDGSVMYVAQPIKNLSGDIIGVVSVGKPVASVLPYLDDTRNRMLITALLISIAALILAGLVAWWLKQSITLVTQYTSALAEDTKKPYFYLGHELNSLTDTIETMKHRLENRAYVTDYVHTLTHELKSPLTAIRASSELLEDDGVDANKLDNEDRQMLIETVGEQSVKMQQLIDRLLLLAKVEQPTFKLNRQLTPLLPLLQSLIRNNAAKQQQQNLYPIDIYIDNKNVTNTASLPVEILASTSVYADQFWLVQVLQNVLDNAIHFAKHTIEISLHSTARTVTIDIFNDGKPLPEYAVAKAFERYFSLSHQSQTDYPTTNQTYIDEINIKSGYPTTEARQTDHSSNTLKKGTGLGLTLVKQVIEHHGGQVIINNVHANNIHVSDGKAATNEARADNTVTNKNQCSGVMVSITLPLA